jgi:peptidylprolyl isomerase
MYHRVIMKLTSVLLIFAATSPALAQTAPKPGAGASTTARKPAAVHSATRPVTHAGACDAELPTLPASIPKIPGCSKALYTLRYIDTLVGTGAPVTPRKWLTVAYTGYLTDGTKFDTSIGKDKDGKDKEPITFPYGAHQVIPGWDTGFEGMNIGGKRRLFIPYQLAYGDSGRPPIIPAKATLVFDVELIAVSENPPKQPAPPTPAARPAGAPATPPTGAPPATPPPTAEGAKPTQPPTGGEPTKAIEAKPGTSTPPPTIPKP